MKEFSVKLRLNRPYSSMIMAAIVFFLLISICSADVAPQWLSPHQLNSMLAQGKGPWLVDIRTDTAYKEGHVEGAMNISQDRLSVKRFPDQKIIILLDDSLGLREARRTAEVLLKKGNKNVYILEGGIPAWQRQGLPLAGKGNGRIFRRVSPEELCWAQENRIDLQVFDLRETEEQTAGPVTGATKITGSSLQVRLEKAAALLGRPRAGGLKSGLDAVATVVLVFPTRSDPQHFLTSSARLFAADVRYLDGGRAFWAVQPKDLAPKKTGSGAVCTEDVAKGKKR